MSRRSKIYKNGKCRKIRDVKVKKEKSEKKGPDLRLFKTAKIRVGVALRLPFVCMMLATILFLAGLRCLFRVAKRTFNRFVFTWLKKIYRRVGINPITRFYHRKLRKMKDYKQSIKDDWWLFKSPDHFKNWFVAPIGRYERWGKALVAFAIMSMILIAVFNLTIPSIPYIEYSGLIFIPGTTYYYSQSLGNDSYDGLYPTHIGGTNGPKQSIPEPSGSGNDEHYFRYGDTWIITVGAYSWNQSGTGTSTPVTYGAYGTSGDGLPLFDGDGGQDCYWDVGGNYIVIENIEWTDFGGNCTVYFEGPNHDVIIDNIYVHDNDAFALGLELVGSNAIYNFEIMNCQMDTCGYGGLGTFYVEGQGDGGNYNIVTHDCDFYDSQGDMISYHNGSSDPEETMGTGCKIFNCMFDTAGNDTVDCNTGNGLEVYDNEVTGWGTKGESDQGIDWDGTASGKCYRNYIHGGDSSGSMPLRITTADTEAWGNLIVDEDRDTSGVVFLGNEATQAIADEYEAGSNNDGYVRNAVNISFIKNTLIYSGTTSGYGIKVSDAYSQIGTISGDHDLENFTISNNIVSYDDSGTYLSYPIYFEFISPNSAEFTIESNVWGPKAFVARDAPNAADRNWTYWTTTLGHDADGANEDPDFTNRTGGDYTLTEGSPAIGLGPSSGTYSPDITYSSYIMGSGVEAQNCAGAFESGGGSPTVFAVVNMTLTNINIVTE